MLKQLKHHPASSLCGLAALTMLAACGSGGGEEGAAFNDTVPPQAGSVRDGLGDDVDTQVSTTTIAANWSDFVDDSGFIVAYEWAIGTTPGGTEVMDWVGVGLATSAMKDALVLEGGQGYLRVRARLRRVGQPQRRRDERRRRRRGPEQRRFW